MPYAAKHIPVPTFNNARATQSDYDSSVHPFLKYAQEEFYLRMALTHMFLDPMRQMDMGIQAWDAAYNKFENTYALDPHVSKMVYGLCVSDVE